MSKQIEKLLTDLNTRLERIESVTKDVMNCEEAAKFLGISKSTLDKMTGPKNMLIATSKVGGTKVFFKKDLIAYVEKFRQEPIAA